jgi:hypothetical protein
MSNGGMTNNEQQNSGLRTDLSLVRRSPFPWSLFVILPAALKG